MKEKNISELQVRQANRTFYDIIADVYEEIDGRRTDEVIAWISYTLKGLSEVTSGDVLLDLGCGSGIVMKSGKQHFKHTYGMDISPEIIKKAKPAPECLYQGETSSRLVCGEGTSIPLKDNSVDVVVCFAVLHHIFDHKPLFKEIYRVLKKGGVLYTDHDMDKAFNDRFNMPLKVYRYIFNAEKKYTRAKKEITEEMYKLSEIHSEGIDTGMILNQLKEIDFSDINSCFHWFGLNRIFNRIMKHRVFSRGSAPLVSITARK